jgi:hypothetical protein
MTIKDFRDMLLTLSPGIQVFHNTARGVEGDYIVWSEASKRRRTADNVTAFEALRIAVDYFTHSEYDENHKLIENSFDKYGVAYSGAVIIYERDTGLTHYAYTAEI